MQDATARPVLQLVELTRTFRQGDREIPVLKGASAELYPGRRWRWSGRRARASRRCCTSPACSRRPTAGGSSSTARTARALGDAERTRVRRIEMGFVYQFHQLLPEFSALENVRHAADDPRRRPRAAAEARAKRAAEHAGARPSGSITGPRSFRAASSSAPPSPARSPTRRALLLADEPTGNLDPETSAHVFHELLELIQHTGVAALIATHNLELAKRMHRVLRLEHGVLIETNPGATVA